jgi:monomeric isocitrate dehydrogenase
MSQRYSEETQKILKDFLETLSKNRNIDADLLVELRQMTNDGNLGNRTRIQQSIAILEAKADELQDRHHTGS